MDPIQRTARSDLPEDVIRRRLYYTDAIVTSIRMLALLYRRLHSNLLAIPREDEGLLERGEDDRATAALLDAWSVIDTANRLRNLLSHWPGVSQRTFPSITDFCRRTAAVSDLRNAVQHLNGEIARFSRAEDRAWGTLRWLVRSGEDPNAFRSYALLPGAIAGCEFGLVVVLPELPKRDVSRIVLTFGEQKVNISWLFEDADTLAADITVLLNKLLNAHPSAGWAFTLSGDVVVKPDSPAGHRPM